MSPVTQEKLTTMWTDKVKAITATVALVGALAAWAVNDRMEVADRMQKNSERITTLEAQRTEDRARLERIEAKLDALLATAAAQVAAANRK